MVQGGTKITFITLIFNNLLNFTLIDTTLWYRPSLFSIHLQRFKFVLEKIFVSLLYNKCVPNELFGTTGTFESNWQILYDTPHFYLRISLVAVVIIIFRSEIVSELLPHSLP